MCMVDCELSIHQAYENCKVFFGAVYTKYTSQQTLQPPISDFTTVHRSLHEMASLVIANYYKLYYMHIYSGMKKTGT